MEKRRVCTLRNPTLQNARKDSETDGDREEVFTLRSPALQDAQKEVYTLRNPSPQDAQKDSETDGDRKVRTPAQVMFFSLRVDFRLSRCCLCVSRLSRC